jgi:VCBS repeat-containing protein
MQIPVAVLEALDQLCQGQAGGVKIDTNGCNEWTIEVRLTERHALAHGTMTREVLTRQTIRNPQHFITVENFILTKHEQSTIG